MDANFSEDIAQNVSRFSRLESIVSTLRTMVLGGKAWPAQERRVDSPGLPAGGQCHRLRRSQDRAPRPKGAKPSSSDCGSGRVCHQIERDDIGAVRQRGQATSFRARARGGRVAPPENRTGPWMSALRTTRAGSCGNPGVGERSKIAYFRRSIAVCHPVFRCFPDSIAASASNRPKRSDFFHFRVNCQTCPHLTWWQRKRSHVCRTRRANFARRSGR